MNKISFAQTLKRDWEIVALLAGIAIVISLVASIIQPFKYEATTKLLVIQNQVSHLDAYTATKSAEKIGKNLSEVVASTVFYDEVTTLNPSIKNEFSTDPLKLRKEWKKDVVATVIPETGILTITAYHEDKQRAAELLQTVSFALVNAGEKYHGGGASVNIQVIDDVVVSRFPMRPNVIMNALFAMVLGVIAGTIFIVLNEAHRVQRAVQKSLTTDEQEGEVIREDVYHVDEPVRSFNLQPVLREYQMEPAKNWKIIEEI